MTIRQATAALLLLFVCLPSLARDPVPTPAGAESRRYVTVSGTGEVSATPDRARLSMGVEVTKPAVKDAQEEANRVVRDFLAQARALGAKDEDIATTALSIRAEYNYGGNTRKFVGYHVSRGIEVVVRDLDRTGDYIKRAIDAGVNSVSDPALESSKADELKRQALAKAALDARAKAQVLADTLSVKLGTVRTIEANVEPPPVQPMPRVMAFAKAASDSGGNEEMGFSTGQVRLTANLSAEFDLIAP